MKKKKLNINRDLLRTIKDRKNEDKNGDITLITLAITIIILLILAGITINIVTGENGKIPRAKLAETEQAQVDLEYEVKEKQEKDGKIIYTTLITFQSSEKIKKIEYGNQILKVATGKEQISIDLEIEKDKEYSFKVTTLAEKNVDKNLIISTVPIERIILEETEVEMQVFDVHKINYSIEPDFAEETNITWISTNEEIATVNDNGTIKAKTAGETTIIAKSNKAQASCHVIVTPVNIITASGTHDETTGTIMLDLGAIVDNASSGDIIYIPEGTYTLESINTAERYVRDCTASGINDKGKKLTFVGENEKTKLIFHGSASKLRDGNAINLTNNDSSIRNLIYEFYPDKTTDSDTGNAIISHSKGKIYNVYFKIHNDYVTQYTYTNHDYLNILMSNCTFYFENTNLIANCYGSGSVARYENILTNYAPVLATEKTNILVKDFSGNIEDTKTDEEVNNREVGVYYGEYAWKK